MADTIKLPGFGNVPKPVAIGGAIAAGVVGIYFYRNKKQQQDAVSAAGSTEIDPATGYPYGSAEDAASLGNQDNYVMPGGIGGGYGYTGYAGGSGSGPFGTGAPGSFNSNAEWAQYVEAYEVNNMGGDASTVGNAIGKYLTGQPLTDQQVGLVQSAIAIGGYPPVSGPNGNPPSYVTSGSTPAPNPNPTPTPTPSPTGTKAGTISNLHYVKNSPTSVTVYWNKATNASQGYAYKLTQLNGVVTAKGNTSGNSKSFSGLHRGWTYNFGIQGLPGGPGNNIHIIL